MIERNTYGRWASRTGRNIVTWLLAAGAIVAMLTEGRTALAGTETAQEWLKKGGVVIDVRSAEEFRQKHLPDAVNIPVDRLSEEVPKKYPDKKKLLLLHCLSGGRSARGANLLKKLGYENVMNLGSYTHAQELLKEK